MIDLHTLRTLGLESELNTKSGKIFGISQGPVEIVGTKLLPGCSIWGRRYKRGTRKAEGGTIEDCGHKEA